MMIFSIALASSTRPRIEIIFLRPLSGFKRLNLGAIALVENNSLVCAKVITIATRQETIIMGTAARIKVMKHCTRSWPISPAAKSSMVAAKRMKSSMDCVREE